MTAPRAFLIGSCIIIGIGVSGENHAELSDDFFNMPLEELKSVKVSTGQLTKITSQQSLAALTVIFQEHIALSPAKNLAYGLILNA